jgi:hypothetical protein
MAAWEPNPYQPVKPVWSFRVITGGPTVPPIEMATLMSASSTWERKLSGMG